MNQVSIIEYLKKHVEINASSVEFKNFEKQHLSGDFYELSSSNKVKEERVSSIPLPLMIKREALVKNIKYLKKYVETTA
ncbi:hypothetical protein RND71_028957 [Anisodus tanguticus]|uniref:Uncharacterized protein n=1 Tax=Anisodus tanguticus TaxID=243964 RepID=A0AAE1V9P7_9SOLA|nr:hypothetical protein RND71_028957 [Anisodus tanguticus]